MPDVQAVEIARVVDLTPTWEQTARMLLVILEHNPNEDQKQFARDEIARMGQMIDQTCSQRNSEVPA